MFTFLLFILAIVTSIGTITVPTMFIQMNVVARFGADFANAKRHCGDAGVRPLSGE